MKKLKLLIPLLLVSIIMNAQTKENFTLKDGVLTYSEVVTVQGKKSDDLYLNALTWINNTFANPKAVIKSKDKELGVITLAIEYDPVQVDTPRSDWAWWTEFDLSIYVKDGRYRCVANHFIQRFGSYCANMAPQTYEQRSQKNGMDSATSDAIRIISPFVASLKKQMLSDDSNW